VDRLERIYRYEQSCEFLPHRLKSLALSLPAEAGRGKSGQHRAPRKL